MKSKRFYINCVQACDRCKLKKRKCQPAQFDATKSTEYNLKCHLCQNTNSKCTYNKPGLKRGRLRKEDKYKFEPELEKEDLLQIKPDLFINYDKYNIHQLDKPKSCSLNLAGPNSAKSDLAHDFKVSKFNCKTNNFIDLSSPKSNFLNCSISSGYDDYHSKYESHSSPNSLNNKFQILNLKLNNQTEPNDTNSVELITSDSVSYNNLVSTATYQHPYIDVTPIPYEPTTSPDTEVESQKHKILLQTTSIIFANNLIDISIATFREPNLHSYIAPLINSNCYLALCFDDNKDKSKVSNFFLITLCLATLSGFFNSERLNRHLVHPNFYQSYLNTESTVANDQTSNTVVPTFKNFAVDTSDPTTGKILNYSNSKLSDSLVIQIYELILTFLITFESDFNPTILLISQVLLNFIKVVPSGILH